MVGLAPRRNYVDIFTTLILLNFGIACVAAYRLFDYQRKEVLRLGEIKSTFHMVLLLYSVLNFPQDMFCDVHYKLWQCDAKDSSSEVLNWEVYSLGRLASPLLTMCLSMMVVTWSDFLRETKYISELVPKSIDAAPGSAFTLRRKLLVVNALCMLMAIIYAAPIFFDPSSSHWKSDDDKQSRRQYSWLVYVDWLLDTLVNFVIMGFMLMYVYRLQRRIRATVVFDQADRNGILGRLFLTVGFMLMCNISIMTGNFVLLSPVIFPGGQLAGLLHWYSDHYLLFSVMVYMPKYFVCYCLLYLMRTPPAKAAINYSTPELAGDNGPHGYEYQHSVSADGPTTPSMVINNYLPLEGGDPSSHGVSPHSRSGGRTTSMEWRTKGGGFEDPSNLTP
eukprot:CAMPEP_0119485912 /NCGR_PEP_ID=MMETSP1344-20130328/12465_1 /TAXON_ID=236787 /ORGANISM="Florenciella parvula, Strain CCMP2471" /LENGTH=389 /DNA_ID=CAMNT_0007520617 /DNA_START=59 /DNA_END=1229 /DNA_ORIENTATION=-